MTGPTPEKIMQLITGGWATSILGAAAQHGIFTALEGNPANTEGVANKTGISLRGAQALLDGLTGLGLLTLSDGRYQNTPDASSFLVKGKPSYLGGMAEVFLQDFATWQSLPEAAKTGVPSAQNTADVADNLIALKKIDSWSQGDYVEKGGWATLPGPNVPGQVSAVAKACATLLTV